MHGDDRPTGADVEAMKAWTQLGDFGPLGGERADTAYGEGRMLVPVPSPEAAREVGEAARAREGHHAEARAGSMRAMGAALGRSYAVGTGAWASGNRAAEEGRKGLRRAGFEERHDGELGTVWVRPDDGRTLTPGEAGLDAAGEGDVPS